MTLNTLSFEIIRLPDSSSVSMGLWLLADPSPVHLAEYLPDCQIWGAVATKSAGSSDIDSSMIIGAIAVEARILNTSVQEWEIKNLVVDEMYQGLGVGRKLLETVISAGKIAGVASLTIATGNSSLHQLKLYHACGFTITQCIPNYFIEHYPDPIYENGMQCRDQVILHYFYRS